MVEVTIRPNHCYSCDGKYSHTGSVPKRIKGRVIYGGDYCIGGKKPVKFKARELKGRVPSWCPKRNSPPILRIFSFKDERSRFMHFSFPGPDGTCSPFEYHYALRYQGRIDMTAAEFLKRSKEMSFKELDNCSLELGDVIEIDDGITPYCFYSEHGVTHCIMFNAKKALKNKYGGE